MRTELSIHAKMRIAERNLRMEWIESALREPDMVIPDEEDPSLEHRLVAIEEREKRVLRVVCDPNVIPVRVVTVHFDRSMKGKL